MIMGLYVDRWCHHERVTLKLKETTKEGLRGSEAN